MTYLKKSPLTAIALLAIFISSIAFAKGDFTDSQIDGFVEAQQKVATIVKNNEKVLKNKGPEFQKVQKKMVKAIQETDISIQTYNQIMTALRSDQDLSERIKKAMN